MCGSQKRAPHMDGEVRVLDLIGVPGNGSANPTTHKGGANMMIVLLGIFLVFAVIGFLASHFPDATSLILIVIGVACALAGHWIFATLFCGGGFLYLYFSD